MVWGLVHTHAVAVNAEYAVPAVAEFATDAEYAVDAELERGGVPRGVEGAELEGLANALLFEHGGGPRGVGGVKAEGQVHARAERDEFHAGPVADAVAVDEAVESIQRHEWP